MYNQEAGKSVKRRVEDIPLKDKKKVEPSASASGVTAATGEGSGKSSPVDKSIDNIDAKNVNRGGGNRIVEKDEMQQTTVMISLKNLALMEAYYNDHGSSRSWIINKALTRFFEMSDA